MELSKYSLEQLIIKNCLNNMRNISSNPSLYVKTASPILVIENIFGNIYQIVKSILDCFHEKLKVKVTLSSENLFKFIFSRQALQVE